MLMNGFLFRLVNILPLFAIDDAVPVRGLGLSWLADPRSAVLLTLVAVLGIGGGRRLRHNWKGRKIVARLLDSDVTPDEIRSAADYGRMGLRELFEMLSGSTEVEKKLAAGQALAKLWAKDELISEEEKAIVLRSYQASWKARRRYPRKLAGPIPIHIEYGVPFLGEHGGIDHSKLEWSHKILGTERAGLEEFTPWSEGPACAEFSISSGDYTSNGPHRLALHARVRTKGLTSPWESELFQVPFQFELDPLLDVGSLRATADEARAAKFAELIRLEVVVDESGQSKYVSLNDDFVLRDPPQLVINAPLPADLAHILELEFQGIPGRFSAGTIVISGQGNAAGSDSAKRVIPLDRPLSISRDIISAAGILEGRIVLTPNDSLAWTDPDIRSVWPNEITTPWVAFRVVRR